VAVMNGVKRSRKEGTNHLAYISFTTAPETPKGFGQQTVLGVF
jgi:hypothetical protein